MVDETYLDASELRANSPSAENKGEVDIFGNVSGGEAPREHLDIKSSKSCSGWELCDSNPFFRRAFDRNIFLGLP